MDVKKNRILIDWITFTCRKDSLSKVFELIGVDFKHFVKMDTGVRGYKQRYYFEGITVAYDGSSWFDNKGVSHDMGIMVDICGKGCRAFESYSSVSFFGLINYLVCHADDYNITRLDVAFDDFVGVLDMQRLQHDVMAHNYVSKFRSVKIEFSRVDDIEGYTLYFGSPKSAIMFRIYDKKAEQKIITPDDHWVRFEMQLRDDRASFFCDCLNNGVVIDELFFNVVNNYLRFVVPSDTDNNRSRWATADYWFNFLDYYGIQSLYVSPGQEYSDDNLVNYLNTYGGALYTLCSLFGFEYILRYLYKRPDGKFNPKYLSLLKSKGVPLRHLMSDISNLGLIDLD